MVTKLKLKSAGAGWGVEISGYFAVREFDTATNQHTRQKEYVLVHYLTPGTCQELYVQHDLRSIQRLAQGPRAEKLFQEIVARGHRPPPT